MYYIDYNAGGQEIATEESTRDIEDTIRRLNIPLHGIKGGKERKNGAETIYEENV